MSDFTSKPTEGTQRLSQATTEDTEHNLRELALGMVRDGKAVFNITDLKTLVEESNRQARIDELTRLEMRHASLGDTSQYYTDAKAFDDRIKELTGDKT